jgi:CxxC-x17-CxxC domain-containing protein
MAMRPFKKAGKFSGSRDRRSEGSSGRFEKRSTGGRFDNRESGGSDRRSGPLEFHETTCAKCGKTCEVPFKPNGTKPIYCRDCFQKPDSFGSRDSYAPRRSSSYEPRARSSERSDSGPSATSGELDKINKKLDKIMKALGIE